MAIKTITATNAFQDPGGTVLANGILTLALSQVASASSAGGGQIEPVQIAFALDATGKITGQPVNLWANDQLTPTGTFYIMQLFNSNGLRVVGPTNWTISGTSPIDVSAINP